MTDRQPPDIRAELERLAREREMMLGGRPLSRLHGAPMSVVAPSGKGGDIVENRMEEGR